MHLVQCVWCVWYFKGMECGVCGSLRGWSVVCVVF